MNKSKRRSVGIKVRNKIIVYVNAILSTVTILLGILALLGVEIQEAALFTYIAIFGACFIAIIQEINTLIMRHDKRNIIISAVSILAYVLVLIIPRLPIPVGDANKTLLILSVIFMCLYMTARFGKPIIRLILDKPSGWLLQVIFMSAILVGGTIFLGVNWNKAADVCYFEGVFLIAEGMIFVFLTLVSGASAKRFVRILIRTHAAEIIFGLIFMMFISSMILEIVESETIKSFGDAMWYCFAVITTIGFGDFAAKSFAGRIITVLLGIYGIGVVALITSIIVNLFNDSVEANRQQAEALEAKLSELEKKEEKLETKQEEKSPDLPKEENKETTPVPPQIEEKPAKTDGTKGE